MKPLHHWEGSISLEGDDTLTLRGRHVRGTDSSQQGETVIRLQSGDVSDVYLGFDDVFTRCDDRSLGLTFQPLRLTLAASTVSALEPAAHGPPPSTSTSAVPCEAVVAARPPSAATAPTVPGGASGAPSNVLYLIVGFKRLWRTSANREWCARLQEWRARRQAKGQ
ncbi:hypothetical protein HXX76_015094 [Chlamydomonas incerta]|uniref:Uncharacterized protein n=1 Tax=Chlamydomonas incerta TaxID=51695 RepID=A0A835VSB1_CHLIN|nr:hypothetical protein HXX76_015094 [Chlamydomonas incerta]|eukprot:KAG2423704.1 hypothetical protein HXX76_015094 [Chlamydomonas incerta]